MSNLILSLKYRLSLLYWFIAKFSNFKRVTFSEMFAHLFGPSSTKFASAKLTLVKSDGKFNYYSVNGYNDIFIYPKTAPFHSLACVLTEGLKVDHWHYYEIPETSISNQEIIVDCGSAEGFFAFKYKDIAEHIYLFEPLPLFIDSLEMQFNESKNIDIMPYALGDVCHKAFMELNSNISVLDSRVSSSESIDLNNHIEINVVTIDSCFYDKGINITYLKADVEGFEEKLILGALNTIRHCKPKIAITTYHEGQDYKKLISIIKNIVPEYKYKIKGIEHKFGNPIMLHMWID